jgi:hypothetical protein
LTRVGWPSFLKGILVEGAGNNGNNAFNEDPVTRYLQNLEIISEKYNFLGTDISDMEETSSSTHFGAIRAKVGTEMAQWYSTGLRAG